MYLTGSIHNSMMHTVHFLVDHTYVEKIMGAVLCCAAHDNGWCCIKAPILHYIASSLLLVTPFAVYGNGSTNRVTRHISEAY